MQRGPSKRPRESIAGHRLVHRIGAGGMAEVWLGARETGGGTTKLAAIKLPARELVADARYRRLFRREAELGAQLEHGNIVRVLDEGEEDGLAYLVMEYIDGVALSRLQPALAQIADESLRIRICAHVVLQVGKALSFAHRVRSDAGNPLGIVHRDVSPQNVLVSQAGEVKLGDWGVSYLVQAAMAASTRSFIHGKPRYMAPEQLAGENRDPRIDIYALGAVFQELLDARPFRADVPEQSLLVDAISGRRPPMVRAIPAELERVLARMLERDPNRRAPTARAVIDELRAWSGMRDMGEELGELCRSLTGVADPRTRPSVAEPAGEVTRLEPQKDAGPTPPPVEPTVRFDTKDGGRAGFGLVIDPTVGIDDVPAEDGRTTPFDPRAQGAAREGTVVLPEPTRAPAVATGTAVLPPPVDAEAETPIWNGPAPVPTAWPEPSRDSWTHAALTPQPPMRRAPRPAATIVAVAVVVVVLVGLGLAITLWAMARS